MQLVKHPKIIICLLLFAVFIIPAASAGQPWSDNPEHIAAMQAYTAYSGELFKAKMDGAIQYIGTLNQSSGTGTLQTDEQQFLSTVSSVQSMSTNDSINQAWATMKSQISQFRNDLKTAMVAGNGSESALQTAVNSAVNADQTTIQNLDSAYWTARETSRLDEFTTNDAQRNGILSNLTAKGISVTAAQGVESQMETLQPQLKSALDARNDTQLANVNAQLGSLGQQFVQDIISVIWQARETTRLAQFTNTTTRMQDRLTNLTARGLDVSSAQNVLSQITSLQPQLQTALENHDETTLQSLNSQLVSLDKQFTQAVQAIIANARSQMNQSTGNRTGYFRRGNQSSASTVPGAI